MEKNMSDLNLNERVVKTLEIVEKRGYNLTIKKLSEVLIGGEIDKEELKRKIKNFKNVNFDGTFVATSGNLNTKKCMNRMVTNDNLQKIYTKIAEEYTTDYQKFCPWVKCIMVSGSMSTEGLGENDDIDFNLIVEDDSKYTSYLLSILLSLKYSIKYRNQFKEKYLRFLTKVICISVIWEEHQVLPFIRRDDQIAYELLNSKVLYNQKFFNNMLDHNLWLKNWFPQVFKKGSTIKKDILSKHDKRILPNIIENISRKIMCALYIIIKTSRLKNIVQKERMSLCEKVKHPYGLFDIPKKK